MRLSRILIWTASVSSAIIALPASISHAQSGPHALNVSGGLFDSNGQAILRTNVNFKLEVRDKSGTCVLYSESHNGENLADTKGQFSLLLGSGTTPTNFLIGGSALDASVFTNRGVTGAFSGCTSGVTLNSGDERVIRVYYDIGSGLVPMSPDVPVVSAAYAMIADTLQGKGAAEFIQVADDGTTSALNQSNTEYAFSFANWPKLKALIDGTSMAYLPMGGTAPFDFNNQRLIRVANPGTSPFDAVNKGYADSNFGGRTADFTGVGPAVGDGKTMIWDQASQKWTVGNPVITGTAGGDLTGSYPNPSIAVSAVSTTKIADNAITAAKISSTGIAVNQIVGTDATTGTTLTYLTCLPGQIMYYVSGTGWQCTTVYALSPVKTVASKTPDAAGNVALNAADISGLGTVVTKDYGSTSGQVPLLDASNHIPAYMMPAGVGTISSVNVVSPLLGGGVSGAVTISLDVGTAANQVVRLNGSAQLPAVDGSLVTGVNATKIGTRTVASTAPSASQVLAYNATSSQWEPMSAAGGSVTNVTAGAGLVAGSITSSGTLNVDVGTGANKIVQLTGSATFPAIDGYSLYNLNASRLATRAVSSAAPSSLQVLGYNATLSQWEPMNAGATGAVTQVTGGTGLLGGTITSTGTLNIDVGTGANKIVQLNGSGAFAAIDGSNLYNVNASKLGTRAVSSSAPAGSQVLGYNATLSQWEPMSAAVGSMTSVVSGTGLVAGTITSSGTLNVDVGTGANKIVQLTGSATFPAIDGYSLYNLNASRLATRAVSSAAPTSLQVLGYNATLSQWEPMSASATGAVTQVTGGTGLLGGTITTTGTLNIDVGTGANKIVQLNGSGAFVAIDASNLYNVNASKIGTRTVSTSAPAGSQVLGYNSSSSQWEPMSAAVGSVTTVTSGTGLIAGTITSSGTINVDVGTTAGKVVQFDASARYPGNDGSLITNVNASKIGTRTVSSAAPAGAQVLGYNSSLSQWEPITAAAGSVTSIVGGSGLLGGTITASGTFAVDSGTGANQIVKLNGSAQIPAVDGSLLTGVNASKLGTRTVSSAAPSGSQVLGFNASLSQWEPMSGAVGSVTTVTSGTGLVAGTITSNGTINVDVGTGANKIAQFDASARYPANDGSLITNVNASKIGTRAVSTAAPGGSQVLGYNATLSQWEPMSAAVGSMTSVASGTGLVAGTITSSGTINVDVGTGANKIVQLNGSGAFAAIDSSNLYNVNASKIGTRTVSAAAPAAAQVLGYNSTLSQWEPTSASSTLSWPLTATPGTTPATAPSYSFAGSTNTGLLSQSAGTLALATSGTARVTVDASGYVGVGTASPQTRLHVVGGVRSEGAGFLSLGGADPAAPVAAPFMGAQATTGFSTSPAYTFWYQSGTGIANPAVDTLSFTTNNSTRMTLLSTGNVGIGTTSPIAALDVAATGTNSALVIPRDTTANRPSTNVANGMLRYNTNTNKFEAYENGAWANMISAGGGTTSFPLLANPGTTPSTAPSYSFSGSANTGVYSPAVGKLALSTQGTTALTVDGTGNVGIGVASPTSKLHLKNNGVVDLRIQGSGTATGMGTSLTIANDAGDVGFIWTEPSGSTYYGGQYASVMTVESGGSNALQFVTDANAPILFRTNVSAERLRVQGTGEVGIGTSTPKAILDVAATGTTSAIIVPRDTTANRPSTNVANGMIRYNTNTNKFEAYENGAWANIISAGGGTASFPLLASPGTTPLSAPSYSFAGSTNTGLLSQSAGSLALSTVGTARLTVTNTGKIGIGTTSPGAALEIKNIGGTNDQVNLIVRNDFQTLGAYDVNAVLLENLNGNGSSKGNEIIFSNGTWEWQMGNDFNEAGWHDFYIYSSTDAKVPFYINPQGHVGINNSNATTYAALEVYGTSNSDSAILIPRASTANRPSTPSNGMLRYNTSTSKFEAYENGAWANMISAGGGTASFPLLASPGTTPSTAPSYSFTGSTNTGLFSQATNTVALATAGTARLSINATGKVGVGTAAPTQDLEVAKDQDGATTIQVTNNNNTSSAEAQILLSSAGMNPGYLAVNPPNYSDAVFAQRLSLGASNSMTGVSVLAQAATGDIRLLTGGYAPSNERLRVDSVGRVGIGTTTPLALLDLATTGTNSALVVPRDTTANRPAANVANGMIRYNTSTSKFEAYENGAWANVIASSGGTTAFPLLATVTGTAATPVYSFAAGGSNEGMYLSGADELSFSVGGGQRVAIGTYYANLYVDLGFPDNNGPIWGNDAWITSNGGAGSHYLTLATGVAERMRIAANGNVGIGSTGASSAALEVVGTSSANSAILIPRATTANRPGTAANGMMRYNTSLAKFEAYENGAWTNMIGASSLPFNGLSAATGTSALDNTNYGQVWNWSTATTQTPLSLNANALTTGTVLSLTTNNAALNSTAGLLNVANTGTAATGLVARIQSNSTAGSGLTVLANGNVGVGNASPTDALTVAGNVSSTGQITGASQTITGGNTSINWNNGNAISTDYNCASAFNFANMRDGGSYTLVITDTGTTKCQFSTTLTGTGAGTVTYYYNPANTTRTGSSRTIYTFLRVGSAVYVSWSSGFQ